MSDSEIETGAYGLPRAEDPKEFVTDAKMRATINKELEPLHRALHNLTDLLEKQISLNTQQQQEKPTDPSPKIMPPVHELTHEPTLNQFADLLVDANAPILAPNLPPTANNIKNSQDWIFLEFWKHDPESWFETLEEQFMDRSITKDGIKYWHVLKNLGADTVREINASIRSLPAGNKYFSIKKALLRKFSETPDQQLVKLFSGYEMGDRLASEFFYDMVRLGGNRVPREAILTVWKERLPHNVRLLIGHELNNTSEQTLIQRADDVMEIIRSSAKSVNAVDAKKLPPHPSASSEEMDRLLARVAILEKRSEAANRNPFANRNRSPFRNQQIRQNARSPDRARSQSPSRVRFINAKPASARSQNAEICFYHRTYGNKAFKCLPPCAFKNEISNNGADKENNNPNLSGN